MGVKFALVAVWFAMGDRFALVAVLIGLFLFGLTVAPWLPVPLRNWILAGLDSPGIVFDRLSILQLAIGFLTELGIVFGLTYAFLGLFMRGR
jgi:hypothetical protein